LWRERTGHPFVFAVWARPLHNPRALLLDFAAARDEGLCRLEAIARQHTARLGLPVAQLVDYLESCINYRLDEPSLRGLETFFDLALEEQLIDTRRPLLWFP
jgi:chorismate dehydratase